SSGLRRFFRYAMFIDSFYLCYVLSLYPFTERYAQPYFFSCLIRQALLEDLALYDNKSWNDPRDFAKPVKAISLPLDVLNTFDHHLIELKNQCQRLMGAHLTPKSFVQVNKITSSYEICYGPHDTQCCMENPEQAFVDYASSHTDKAGGKCLMVHSQTAPSTTILKTLTINIKGLQQCEMTDKIDTVLKAINDQIIGALPSEAVKKLKMNVNSTSPASSDHSYPTRDPSMFIPNLRGKFVRQPHDDKKSFRKIKEENKGNEDRRCFKCEDDFKKDEICLMALDNNEVLFDTLYYSSLSLDSESLKIEYNRLCKINLRIINKNKHLKAINELLNNEACALRKRIDQLEKNKEVSVECQSCVDLRSKVNLLSLKLASFKSSSYFLKDMIENQISLKDKHGLGFTKGIATIKTETEKLGHVDENVYCRTSSVSFLYKRTGQFILREPSLCKRF
nr:MAK10-like protein [Tanacetum cinerariifolium]